MRLKDVMRFVLALIAMLALAFVTLRVARELKRTGEAQVLTLAISGRDMIDLALLRAFSAELAERKLSPRLNLVETEDARDAARALAAGRVDLAVVRPDIETPNGASALLRLRASPLVLVTRKPVEMTMLGDLEGKVVGVEQRDAAIIDEINGVFAQSQRQFATRKLIKADEIESMLNSKKVDAVLFTPSLAKGQAGPALLRHLSSEESTFKASAVLPDDVSALIASLASVPVKESGLPKPLRGEDEDEVVCASYLIMARNALSTTTVATFTERMFYMRAAISKRSGRPAGYSSGAGENVTASTVPLHKGAIEYYEREQKTFFERYSDLIWIGVALSGMISSLFAWFVRSVGRRRAIHIDNVLCDLATFAAGARHIPDEEALAVREAELDALVARVVEAARSEDLSEGDLAAVRFASEHARHALAQARLGLIGPQKAAI